MMMKAVIDICDEFGVDAQLSLERHMKCGFGLCGNCCVDPDGLRMCMEGPCIDKALAKRITEFGRYHRDGTGTQAPLLSASEKEGPKALARDLLSTRNYRDIAHEVFEGGSAGRRPDS